MTAARSAPGGEQVEALASSIAASYGAVARITRFPTGLDHHVFDVVLADGSRLVVRMGHDEESTPLPPWHPILSAIGVPLPAVFGDGLLQGTPFLVLERLPGHDLGDLYEDLTSDQRRALAQDVVAIQNAVHALPSGEGYGYVPTPTGPWQYGSWTEVVLANLGRSRPRLAHNGLVADSTWQAVRIAVEGHQPLRMVQPTAFLDDTTTKNVIVHEGRLSGIVDVDVVCFGDPLYTLGLTQVALAASGSPLDYTAVWCDLVAPERPHHERLSLYRMVFCLDLLSEHGQAFNRSEPLQIAQERVDRLQAQLQEELSDWASRPEWKYLPLS